MSSRSAKVWPQKRGSVLGKQMDASMWFASMSASRSFCCQQPGRISSKVTAPKPNSSNPAAADSFINGETIPS